MIWSQYLDKHQFKSIKTIHNLNISLNKKSKTVQLPNICLLKNLKILDFILFLLDIFSIEEVLFIDK